MFEFRQVLIRLRKGDTDRQIARSRAMGRNKIAALRTVAQQTGWLDADRPLPTDEELASVFGTARRARTTISSVEPHREFVERWSGHGIGGAAIHAALCRDHGFTGSYSAVHRMIRSLNKSQLPEATVRLHFEPGEAAQVDFGTGPQLMDPATDTIRRTWCFVMTLCFSRHQYIEFVWDQSVATWLGCHRRAFEWFGAVPARTIIDNPKCAITKACIRDPIVQRAYAEAAEGYGFRIDPCPPADPQKKGIVESGVKYVKCNFLPLRTFRDMGDLNAQARHWVMHEAGERIHGTTREKPLERFEIEQAAMVPLPSIAPDLGLWTKVTVHRDCHVKFEYNLYSAPFSLIGKCLWLRATDTAVTLYQDFRLVATHLRARKPGTRRTVRDHLPPEAQAYFYRDRSWCVAQASKIGPACSEFVSLLLSDKIVERLRAAQGVLKLADMYSQERLEAACSRAITHHSIHYRTIKGILAGNFDQLPAEPAIAAESGYAVDARFVRSAKSLFTAANATAPKQSRRGASASPQLKLIRN